MDNTKITLNCFLWAETIQTTFFTDPYKQNEKQKSKMKGFFSIKNKSCEESALEKMYKETFGKY